VLILLLTFTPDTLLEAIAQRSWLSNQAFCTFYGFWIQFFSVAAILWIVLIGFNLFQMIYRLQRNTQQFLPLYHWFVWNAAVFCSALPLTTDSYAPSAGTSPKVFTLFFFFSSFSLAFFWLFLFSL
jgi:hypothetical protein